MNPETALRVLDEILVLRDQMIEQGLANKTNLNQPDFLCLDIDCNDQGEYHLHRYIFLDSATADLSMLVTVYADKRIRVVSAHVIDEQDYQKMLNEIKAIEASRDCKG